MNNIKNIKKQIQQKELQIKKLQQHETESDVCSSLCNKLILEKAILKKELETMKENKLLSSFKKFFGRKDKLICDYFRN